MTVPDLIRVICETPDQESLNGAAKITKLLVSFGPNSSFNFLAEVAASIHLIADRFTAHPDNDASDLLVDVIHYVLTDHDAVASFLKR